MTAQVVDRLAWLQGLPNGWKALGLRFILDRNDGGAWGSDPTGDGDVVVLRSTEQTVDGRWCIADPAYRSLTHAEHKATCLVEGDLLVTKSSGSETHIGKTTIVDADVAALRPGYSNFMQRLRVASNNHPRFVWYLLNSPHAKIQLNLESTTSTGLANLNGGLLGRLVFPVPPFEVQVAIASYLDAETARIDGLIQEKSGLLNTLAELRSATIFEAVYVDVPGWQQSRLKFVADAIVDTEHKTCPYFEDGKFLVVRTTNIKSGRLTLEGAKFTNEDGFREWTQRAVPEPGDILLTREAPAGEACLVPEGVPLCVGQRTVLIKVNRDVAHPAFVLWSLYGGLSSQFIADLSRGSTVPHFNMADIGNIPLCLGPIDEQLKRAAWLEARLKEVDDLTEHVNREIEMLRELRSATITDAVLGRIDVRQHMKH